MDLKRFKICRICNEWKSFDDLKTDNNLKSGKQNICKKCDNRQRELNMSIVRKTNPVFRYKVNIKSLLNSSVDRMGFTNKSSLNYILCCDFETFKKHIEIQFEEGMTWDNHGEWHLDHIIPISKAKTIEDVIMLNHYTNFQPLWASDNIIKSDKLCQ